VDEVLGQVADHASVLRDVQLGVSVASSDVASLIKLTEMAAADHLQLREQDRIAVGNQEAHYAAMLRDARVRQQHDLEEALERRQHDLEEALERVQLHHTDTVGALLATVLDKMETMQGQGQARDRTPRVGRDYQAAGAPQRTDAPTDSGLFPPEARPQNEGDRTGREEELPLEEEAALLVVEADTPQKGRRHSWRWRCCQRWRRRCSWRSRRYSWRRQQRRQRRRRRCR
jgi:hypothetical protein